MAAFAVLVIIILLIFQYQRGKSGLFSTGLDEDYASARISKSLDKVISERMGWNPIHLERYGEKIPDFTVTDINGKTHNLSDYHGKNVFIVMWATWCGPCMAEVPHLIALREIMSEDQLAILAISNEPVETVKAMAARKKLTYTVISHQDRLPSPLSEVRGIPCGFFIRPDGTLKIVTEGSLHLGEMKMIILAE